MYGSIKTWYQPCLRNYAQALRHFNDVKPIRGSGLRPLGKRTIQTQLIEQRPNGDIVARLYISDVLIYHKDGSITVDFCGYHTQSTSQFLSTVSPYSVYTNGYVVTEKGSFKADGNEGLRILPDGTPVNPRQEEKVLVDRKKGAAVRKKLKTFVTWAETCIQLSGGMFRPKYLHPGGNPLQAVLERDCQDSYMSLAQEYFNNIRGTGWKERLYADAYRTEGAFTSIPVPLGEQLTGTSWYR